MSFSKILFSLLSIVIIHTTTAMQKTIHNKSVPSKQLTNYWLQRAEELEVEQKAKYEKKRLAREAAAKYESLPTQEECVDCSPDDSICYFIPRKKGLLVFSIVDCPVEYISDVLEITQTFFSSKTLQAKMYTSRDLPALKESLLETFADNTQQKNEIIKTLYSSLEKLGVKANPADLLSMTTKPSHLSAKQYQVALNIAHMLQKAEGIINSTIELINSVKLVHIKGKASYERIFPLLEETMSLLNN